MVIVCFATGSASAQDVRRITAEQACRSCSIEIEDVTLVTSPNDLGLTPRDRITVASDGTTWVVPFAMRHAILRYQPDGTQDLRIVGRGQGPREFLFIERIQTASRDGTLYVFGDAKLNRYTPAGEFIDTVPFPRQLLDVLIRPDGSLLLNATVRTQESVGCIFHLVGSDGRLHRSFGPETAGFEFDPTGTRRVLALAGGDAFWAGARNRYELDLWETDGVHRGTLVREVDWFEPWTGTYEPPYEQPPPPRVWDITTEERTGLVWVLLLFPAENFSPLPTLGSQTDLLAPSSSDSPALDTLIEVLDPESGQLVARRTFSNTTMRGFSPGLHVTFEEVDEDGDQAFRVARLSLRRGP